MRATTECDAFRTLRRHFVTVPPYPRRRRPFRSPLRFRLWPTSPAMMVATMVAVIVIVMVYSPMSLSSPSSSSPILTMGVGAMVAFAPSKTWGERAHVHPSFSSSSRARASSLPTYNGRQRMVHRGSSSRSGDTITTTTRRAAVVPNGSALLICSSLFRDNRVLRRNIQPSSMALQSSSSSSSSASSSSSSSVAGGTEPSTPMGRFSKRVAAARIIFLSAIFGIGYRLGAGVATSAVGGVGGGVGGGGSGWSYLRRVPIAWTLLVAILLRDFWSIIPAWAKPRLVERAISDTAILLGMKKLRPAGNVGDETKLVPSSSLEGNTSRAANNNNNNNNRSRRNDISSDDKANDDDISNFDIFFGKLGAVARVFQDKLSDDNEAQATAINDDGETTTVVPFNLQGSFLALLRLRQKSKDANLPFRDDLYASSGVPATRDDIAPLVEWLDYADWAYDEVEGKPLKELLDSRGYSLLKHDKTALPGYVGHYVAIPTDPTAERIALIGVKGTSTMEDLITDMCGAAVAVELDGPYVRGRSITTLRAHDGILIGTRRLARDLQPIVEQLLLPTGYRIVVVGHSLGAAAGALLAILLRSQIPALQKYDDVTTATPSNRLLQVYAFASPPILDLQNALAVRPFVTTIVNDADIVTRCNVGTVESTVDILKCINARLYKVDQTKRERRQNLLRLPFGGKTENDAGAVTVEEPITPNSKDDGTLESDEIDPDEQLLSDARELQEAIINSTTSIPLDDKDYLYVPGKVILMYDEWSSKNGSSNPAEALATTNINVDSDASLPSSEEDPVAEEETMEEIPEYSADRAVVCDGTVTALRYIEFDKRMIFDHNTLDYMQSVKSVLGKLEETPSSS